MLLIHCRICEELYTPITNKRDSRSLIQDQTELFFGEYAGCFEIHVYDLDGENKYSLSRSTLLRERGEEEENKLPKFRVKNAFRRARAYFHL